MKILFVRHGESEANLLRVISNRGWQHGLTERGKEQAAALGRKLQRFPVTRLYTSPLLRAVQTGEILAGDLGVGYEVTGALREFDCGVAEGRSDQASWDLYHELWHDWLDLGRWEQRIEGGESYLEVRARFVPFVEHLVAEHAGDPGSLILVGHGGLYQAMLPLVLGNVDRDFVSTHPIQNAGLIVAEAGEAGLICSMWCDTPLP